SFSFRNRRGMASHQDRIQSDKGNAFMKKKAEKRTEAEALRAELATVSTVILSTCQGITVEQDTAMRRSIEAAGGNYKVVKNTIAERAAEGTTTEGLLK